MRSARPQWSSSAEVVPADNTSIPRTYHIVQMGLWHHRPWKNIRILRSSFLSRKEFRLLGVLDRGNDSFQDPLKVQ
jgi:hypothetical protein